MRNLNLSTDFYGSVRRSAVKLAFFAREKRPDLGPHKWRRRGKLHLPVPLSHILKCAPFMRPWFGKIFVAHFNECSGATTQRGANGGRHGTQFISKVLLDLCHAVSSTARSPRSRM